MGIKLVEQMLGICDQLVADAAVLVSPHDDADIAAFAARLCSLGGLPFEEQFAKTGDLAIPGDFRHLRLCNLNTNMSGGGIFSGYQQALVFKDVLITMSIHAERDDVTSTGYGNWTETVALPVRDRGVLELGMVFSPLH